MNGLRQTATGALHVTLWHRRKLTGMSTLHAGCHLAVQALQQHAHASFQATQLQRELTEVR